MTEKAQDGHDRFARKMIDILNAGAVNAAMAMGYRTGLFDVMDLMTTPQTAEAVSRQAGLHPRYVKEWLGVMATAGIVEAARGENGETRFFLPKAHGDVLARRAGNANLGVYTQEIPLLIESVMEAVVDGFRTGRGVGYDRYPRFQAFMSELADAKHRQVLVNRFLPSVEGGRLVKQLHSGIQVCDLGCAEGVAVLLMAEHFPASRFIGMDISLEAVEKARADAQRLRVENARFVRMDAAILTQDAAYRERFDYVTAFDAIHDQTHPLEALRGVYHMLKPGGRFSMVDIAAQTDLVDNLGHPMGPFLYTVSLMHCMPVGLMDGGMGLGMMWGREKAVSMLETAGFNDIRVDPVDQDPFNLHYLSRK